MSFAFNTFAASSPPWSLQALDNNFAALVNGSAALNVASVATPIVDSGSTGSLLLRTNNGTTHLVINDFASAVNLTALRGAATGSGPFLGATGADTNIDYNIFSKGAGNLNFLSDGSAILQFQVLRTAAADRNAVVTGGTAASGVHATFGVTGGGALMFTSDQTGSPTKMLELRYTAGATQWVRITGGNGVNATIFTNIGGIDISSSAVRFPSIGTTASAANAFLDNAASNNLLRSTSSLRYKKLLGELSLDDARRIVFGAKAIVFQPIEGGRDHIGLSAEWMAELDERVITRDEQGRPDWVQYPHLTAPLMLVVQDMEQRLKELESR